MSQDTEITLNGNILEIRIRKLEKQTPVIISINNQTIFNDIIDSKLDYNYPLTFIFTDELDVKIDIPYRMTVLDKDKYGFNDDVVVFNEMATVPEKYYTDEYECEEETDKKEKPVKEEENSPEE